MAIYGYGRVSMQIQVEEGESLGVQQRQIEGYAMQHGMTLAGMYVERGVSGSVPLNDRLEGKRMMATLRAGDVVIAAKLDRVFRSALDALQMVEEFKARKISLILLDLGGDVTGNGMSKLFLTIMAAVAEAERDRIRERITTVKRDQKTRGRYLGGKVPYGFRVGTDGALEPIPEEQPAITIIREMRADGATLRAIQAALACEGVKLSLDAIQRIAKDAPQAA